MGIGLVHAMILCFLEIGLVDVTITQIPRYQVKRMGEKILLECKQDMSHDSMFWYRQDPGLGPRLIYLSFDVDSYNKGDIPEGYSVSRKKLGDFSLSLEWASINQTSVYLCASSISTALHRHILSTQKEQLREENDSDSGLMVAPMLPFVLETGDHSEVIFAYT